MTKAHRTPSSVNGDISPAVTATPATTTRVLVVIPALNESGSVGEVVRSVLAVLPGADVLVVDDHSTDDTGERARAAGARVATLPYTLGVGGAMRTGYSYARRHGYDHVVQVDADGQHDARHLPELVAGLAGADIVIGARFAGGDPYAVGRARRFVMVVLARTLSALLEARLTDVTSGYRALGPRAVTVFAEHYPCEYLGDTVEALVIGRRFGLSVTQVPVRMTRREHGRPSQGVVGSVAYLFRAFIAIGLGLVRRWPRPAALEDVR